VTRTGFLRLCEFAYLHEVPVIELSDESFLDAVDMAGIYCQGTGKGFSVTVRGPGKSHRVEFRPEVDPEAPLSLVLEKGT